MLYNRHELLSTLCRRGVKLWVDNKELHFQALKGQILPAELNQLRQMKAEVIELLEQAQFASELPLKPRELGCEIPLSVRQSACWGYLKMNGGLSWRMCITPVRILGPLSVSRLETSVEAVVKRHESLRTRIVSDDRSALQQVDATCEGHFELVDVSDTSAAEMESHVTRLGSEFVEEKFNVSVGPLFLAKLFRLSHREHVLILALDHMISDDESNVILSAEIWAIYNQSAQRRPPPLPQLSVQFSDYAVWQQQGYDSLRSRHEAYWKKRLNGMPDIQFPADEGLLRVGDPVGMRLQIPIGETLSNRLRDLAQKEKTLLPLIVLTIYVAVISRWCNQLDLHMVFVSNGRSRIELINMIGFLALDLHLRIQISDEDSFLGVLSRVKQELEAAFEHQDFIPGIDIIPEGAPAAYFNWSSDLAMRTTKLEQQTDPTLTLSPFPCSRTALPFLFGSFFMDSCAGIIWTVEYRNDMFAESTIRGVGRNIRVFAEEFVRSPLTRVTSISMQV